MVLAIGIAHRHCLQVGKSAETVMEGLRPQAVVGRRRNGLSKNHIGRSGQHALQLGHYPLLLQFECPP